MRSRQVFQTVAVGKLSPVTMGATDSRVLLSVGECPEQPHKLEALAAKSGRLEWQTTLGANAILPPPPIHADANVVSLEGLGDAVRGVDANTGDQRWAVRSLGIAQDHVLRQQV